jgi:soluble lytic murein transglycosylase-like protein
MRTGFFNNVPTMSLAISLAINTAMGVASALSLAALTSVPASANTVSKNASDPELRKLLSKAIEASNSFEDKFEAEVWLVDMSQRMLPFIKNEKRRLSLLRHVHREATRVKLVPELVLAVIEVESRFDSYAISKSGAQGLMQVMPFWLKEIGHPDDNLIDIITNLRMGCTILKYYMDMEKNNLHNALARYNGSAGSRVYSNKVLDALRLNWRKR